MKIEHNNKKIAYYLKQLFQSPFYVPRDMGTYDEHQWRQARAIFQEMQSINEDTILTNGGETWENIHLKPYGLNTDNINIGSDGTVLITETLKSRGSDKAQSVIDDTLLNQTMDKETRKLAKQLFVAKMYAGNLPSANAMKQAIDNAKQFIQLLNNE